MNNRKRPIYTVIFTAIVLFASSAFGQDVTRLGGELTSTQVPNSVALELPAPNVISDERFQNHLAGHTDFHGSFEGVKVDGKQILGPFFNHNACGSCHFHDGRGPIQISRTAKGSAVLVKVSLRGLNADRSPRNVPGVGEQLQDHGPRGKTRFNIRLKWRNVKGNYPDGTKYTLRKPSLNFEVPKISSKKIVHSIRMTPSVIGMGLLEAIPEETIRSMSDPDDSNGDGISGRVSEVIDHEKNTLALGRFGFRASHPSIKQQSAAAFVNDMGITNEVFKGPNGTEELSHESMARVVLYQQIGGVTPARDQDDPDVVAGKTLFQKVGCDGCHKITLQTGTSDVPEVANQEIHPFTDLLLHDMGPALADKRPEFSANGNEWRTTPLWGLGLFDVLSSSDPGFLHDGRARTFEEAILWHGGEAQGARDRFKNLAKTERDQLIRFLRSL